LLKEILWCVSNISASNGTLAKMTVDVGFLDLASNTIKLGVNQAVKVEAAWLVANVFSGLNENLS